MWKALLETQEVKALFDEWGLKRIFRFLGKNKKRDKLKIAELLKLGWKSLVVWECELDKGNSEILDNKIISFLEDKH